jgi:hypothetical protein
LMVFRTHSPSAIRSVSALLAFSIACATHQRDTSRSSSIPPVATLSHVRATTCTRLSVTIVCAGDAADIKSAATTICAALIADGFVAKIALPENVIGNWIGTYIVPSDESCDSDPCSKAVEQSIRRIGFRPGRNNRAPLKPISNGRLQEAFRCGYYIYVGDTPRADGQFILY